MAFQTFTPIEYLKIDIANNFGHDKMDWDDRIAWFDENQDEISALACISSADEKNPDHRIAAHPLMKQADAPALFYAGVMAWDRAREGKSIGYPVSLDATASGAQLLAVMIGCEKSARLCNVVDTGRREDLYTNINNFMNDRLEDLNVTRADSKQAVMTSLYGSKAMPKAIFGEGEKLETFYAVMEEEAPGIWELNQALLDLWQSDAYSYDWVLPDNFHVHTKVMAPRTDRFKFLNTVHEVISYENRPTQTGLSIGANATHSVDGLVVKEVSRRCTYDPQKIEALTKLVNRKVITQLEGVKSPNEELVATLWNHYQESGFLSARILELIDEQNIHLVNVQVIKNMLETLPKAPFEVLSVHD